MTPEEDEPASCADQVFDVYRALGEFARRSDGDPSVIEVETMPPELPEESGARSGEDCAHSPLNCIVCGEGVRITWFDGRPGTASGAVLCQTSGNYGSRILDGDPLVVFVLCDPCLLERRGRCVGLRPHKPRTQWSRVDLEPVFDPETP